MGPLRGFGHRVGERIAVATADAIALVAGSTLAYYRNRYRNRASRFVWIPNGVDVDRYRGRDRAAWRRRQGYSEDDRLLIYVGRYESEKGLGRMLQVVRALRRNGQRWHLVCAGSGTEAGLLNEAAATWGADFVRNLGYLSSDGVADLVAAGDVGLLLSDFEGLSNSLLESLAAGLPVVATNVGDNDVVLRHLAPELVSSGNPDDVAERVRWAWDNRHSLAAGARTVADRFSLSARAERIERLITTVAEGRIASAADYGV
jgi:glycosyltransferase involved in cell wall biosynthesis